MTKKIAILISGQLRFEDINHFNNFYNKIKIYDILFFVIKNI